MRASEPVQVVLEVEADGDTISGQVSVEGAPPRGFFGWLELIDRLDRAAARSQETRGV